LEVSAELRLKAINAIKAEVRHAKFHLYFRFAGLYLEKFWLKCVGVVFNFARYPRCLLLYKPLNRHTDSS